MEDKKRIGDIRVQRGDIPGYGTNFLAVHIVRNKESGRRENVLSPIKLGQKREVLQGAAIINSAEGKSDIEMKSLEVKFYCPAARCGQLGGFLHQTGMTAPVPFPANMFFAAASLENRAADSESKGKLGLGRAAKKAHTPDIWMERGGNDFFFGQKRGLL